MNIRIKYFGRIAELANKAEEELRIDDGVVLSDLDKELCTRYKIEKQYYRLSVNQKLVDNTDVDLKDEDEIAYLPPFAGG